MLYNINALNAFINFSLSRPIFAVFIDIDMYSAPSCYLSSSWLFFFDVFCLTNYVVNKKKLYVINRNEFIILKNISITIPMITFY